MADTVALTEIAAPQPLAGRLVAETLAVGVCGTDHEIAAGLYGEAPPGRDRLVIGHESLARVLEAPAGSDVRVGDLVVGIVRRPDPVPCPACAIGEWDMCRNGRFTERGIKARDGYGAARISIDPAFAVPVPPDLGALGILTEPASVVAKAWEQIERIGRRSGAWRPRRVLVTGAGPIGLLAALMGVQRRLEVHVFDRVSEGPKPALVRDLGAEYHAGSLAALEGLEPDIVVECTGASAVVLEVMNHTARGGIVCLTGVSSGSREIRIDVGALNRSIVLENDLVFGSVNANRRHYAAAIGALAAADAGWLSRLVTRRVPLARWREAFERRPGDVKVVIDFGGQRVTGRIEDYGLIGDCESAALVGRDGSIDWLCWPRFDSDACFAALLGTPANGRWLLAPQGTTSRVTRRYRDDTLILETRFETADGAVTLVDFMPPRRQGGEIVRLAIGESGRVPMRMELILRFGYGATVPWVTRLEDGGLRAIAGPDMAVLRTPVALHGENLTTVARFDVPAGEIVPFILSYGPSHRELPPEVNPRAELERTERWWCEWAARSTVTGEHRDAVMRSLITLKALSYAPTGGIVAAPTTSLPECLGGERNWDYRFCWLRDATLTLLALMDAGYFDEARAWRDWLLRAVAGSPDDIQIMYGIGGERRLTEWKVPWLRGYANSTPVRIGNAAHTQLQLDVFGELMDALHHARRAGLAGSEASWALQQELIGHLETVWDQPDSGIWEARGPARHFTYSKVMCWVAMDRALKAARTYGLGGPVDRWQALAGRIHDEVCRRGIDPERNCFVRAYGGRELDASLLLLPQLGFLPPEDARVHATIRAVEEDLLRDGFVHRYDTAHGRDGLPPGEGAFLACSFWLADAYELCGRHADAQALFERLLDVRNDLGLLAEEYDAGARRQAGNFPQAFSHVALVNTALNLTRARKPAEQRAERASAA